MQQKRYAICIFHIVRAIYFHIQSGFWFWNSVAICWPSGNVLLVKPQDKLIASSERLMELLMRWLTNAQMSEVNRLSSDSDSDRDRYTFVYMHISNDNYIVYCVNYLLTDILEPLIKLPTVPLAHCPCCPCCCRWHFNYAKCSMNAASAARATRLSLVQIECSLSLSPSSSNLASLYWGLLAISQAG